MSRSSSEILSQEFLQVRAKILEIAAFYDRFDEAGPSQAHDHQFDLLRQGCELLADDRGDKAARVQLLFSREYDENWREQFGV
jgi:hypothetical protein